LNRHFSNIGILAVILCCNAFGEPDYAAWVGKDVETTRKQDLHSTFRTGLFCEYSTPDVGALQVGERLKVVEVRSATCGFFRKYTYLRVKHSGGNRAPVGLEGYIRVQDGQDKVKLASE